MRELLPLLPKPSRYLGIEEGSVHKDPERMRLHVGLVFPDLYEVGMSYLGQKILYGILNERPFWLAERVFAPCRDAGAVLRDNGAPLCTLESDTPLSRLDLLGFSVTHELCYTNILYILDLAGIPLRAAQRRSPRADGRPWPLILAGGGCTLAAEPLAPFVDLMLLGEGEEALPEILEQVEEAKGRSVSRGALLLALSEIPGVYVPAFFEEGEGGALRPLHAGRAVRRVVPDMDKAPYPAVQPVPFGAVHNRLALEIGRGCTRGCRFCQAGSTYRPVRERRVETLKRLMHACLASTGFDDLSYLSLSTGDFSALKELFMDTVERCAREQVSVSLPSLRVGSIDDAIMERMAAIRRTGATLAPEAGSQRLRDVINKGISEEELILHVRKLFEHGWQQVKLYFMIGLPTETDDDLLAIVDLCRKARDAAGPGIKRLQITAAVSPFVPKAHTPFQWEAQIAPDEIRRRVGLLLDAVKKEKRLTLRWHEPEMSALEGLFSRGDRRLAAVVESAYRKGAIFSSWKEECSLAPWLEALAEQGLALEDYTGARALDAPLPWDHLHSGLSREFFLREREKALRGVTVPDCRYAACRQCGVCDGKTAPSLLERGRDMPQDGAYKNILNRPQRDQDAHSVSLDQYGRVIVRGQDGAPKETGKNAPPALAPHLIVKAARWRVLYARKDEAAYLSQLEIQHIFERALRRAAVAPSFSQGFHPLPLLSFGRALPVGVASECEWFALFLRERPSPRRALEALNAALPRGLRVTAIDLLPLEGKEAKVNDPLKERYRMELLLSEWASERAEAFAAAWRDVAAAPAIPWLREAREGKKAPRELDARAFFADITLDGDVNGDAGRSCLLDLDWSKGYVSPLALCFHVLAAVGHAPLPQQLRLTKIGMGA